MNTEQLPLLSNDKDQSIELTTAEREKVETYKSQIDMNNTSDIIQFGAASQNQMVNFSENVLRQVRTKDMGAVGETLSGLVADLKSFDNAINKGPIWNFFHSLRKKLIYIKAEYSRIEKNVGDIQIQMEKHYQTLLKDIHVFDSLFEQNEKYFRELSLYICAGEEKLAEVLNTLLPNLKKEAEEKNDPAIFEKVRTLEQQAVRFEKKIHDLKLSRMISLQLAPQIRLVQNNSVTLTEKIHSTIVNTLPLWRNQMVLALGLVHSQQALDAQRSVTNATNEMLQRNSSMLRTQSSKVSQESERSIIDIETIRKINNDLFATVNDIVSIQQAGRQKRQAAEAELRNAENELRNFLTNGKS